jgi:hypothetical protein
MNKLASIALGASFLFGVTAQLCAQEDEEYDHDRLYRVHGYEDSRIEEAVNRGMPIAYYPTLHYYSKQGTIVYNFVPLDRAGLHRASVADAVLLSPSQIAHSGANTRVVLHPRRLVFRETKVTPVSTQGPISPETTPAVRPTPPDTVTPATPAPADTTATPAPADTTAPAAPAPAK